VVLVVATTSWNLNFNHNLILTLYLGQTQQQGIRFRPVRTVYLSQTPGPPPYRAPYLRTARQKRHPARLTKGSLHKGSTSPRLAARTPRNTAQRHRTTADISTLTSPSRSTRAMDTCVVVEMSPHPSQQPRRAYQDRISLSLSHDYENGRRERQV
jgi:hypothetical protein